MRLIRWIVPLNYLALCFVLMSLAVTQVSAAGRTYKSSKDEEKPEYEIYLDIDEVGVVHSYKVDYGNFEIKAILKKFELLPKTTCKY